MSKQTGIYYKYDENVDTSACVYVSQKDYDDAGKTLKNGDSVYVDNIKYDTGDKDDKHKHWRTYAYIIEDKAKIIIIFK